MGAPVTIPEKYVNCNGATYVIGTAPNTATLTVMDGGIKRTMGVQERTNNYSLGEYEDVGTITKTTGQFKCAFKGDGTMPSLDAGKIFHTKIDVPNGPTFEADCRYNDIDGPVMDVQNGLVISFSITNQGPTTFTMNGG